MAPSEIVQGAVDAIRASVEHCLGRGGGMEEVHLVTALVVRDEGADIYQLEVGFMHVGGEGSKGFDGQRYCLMRLVELRRINMLQCLTERSPHTLLCRLDRRGIQTVECVEAVALDGG